MTRADGSAQRARARVLWRAEAAYGAVYAGLFLALGAITAFWPVWLAARGLSETAIGWLASLTVGARILGGLFAPALAEGFGATRLTLVALSLGAAVIYAAHLPPSSILALAALTVLSALALGGVIPLADADGYAAAARLGFSYQRARSVGSAGFLSATLGVGALIGAFGEDIVMVFVASACALAAVGAWATPPGPDRASAPLPDAPAPDAPAPDAPAHDAPVRAAIVGVIDTLRAPELRAGFIAAAAIQSSHAVYYTYGSVHWAAQGAPSTVIGALWAWGVAAEIAFFLFGQRAMRRLGPRRAFALGGLAGALRWTVMTADPSTPWLFALQTTHALSFGATHLALLAFIAAARPEASATAQGAASAIIGAGLLIGTALSTALYPALGASAYGLGAALALIGVVAAAAAPPRPARG